MLLRLLTWDRQLENPALLLLVIEHSSQTGAMKKEKEEGTEVQLDEIASGVPRWFA